MVEFIKLSGVLFHFTCLFSFGDLHQATIADKKLFTEIFANYSNELLPAKKGQVKTHITLSLENIVEVNEREQYVIITLYIGLFWTDEFLTWDPFQNGGVDSMTLTPSNIWKPDIVIYNSLEDDEHTNLDQAHHRVALGSSGNIGWYIRRTMKTGCPIKVKSFPYDTQTCPIKMGSWNNDNYAFKITDSSFDLDDKYTPNSGWNIGNLTSVIDNSQYPFVTFHITIIRKSLFYAVKLILPTAVLAFLTTLTFILPAESGERMGLSVTLLLAMVVFMLIVADITPQSSLNIPVVGIFFTTMFLEMVVLLIAMCCVMRCYCRQPYDAPVTGLMRSLVLDRLSYWVGVRDKKSNAVSNDNMVVTVNVNVDDVVELVEVTASEKSKCLHGDEQLQRIERKFDVLLEKLKGNDEDDEIIKEWRIVGLTLDRCLCIVFILILLIITIACFVSAPPYVR